MIEFSVNNLTKYYAANKIFEQISFDVKTGERVGLIGQNGCGKTTLLKILMGTEDYQGGEVNIRKNARLGCLDQIPVYDDTVRTMDVMESAFEGIYEIKRQMRLLEERMKQPENDGLEKALRAYGKLAEQYEQSGGYELETRIGRVAAGLQITDSLKERTFNRLSGGERTRVMLAKLLLEEPDVLLLDEPTNHLDLETIQWLEGFLREYKGTVLVISHDRYFLDNVTGKIIEMEFDRANIYQGNYSYYTVEKERRFLIDYRNYVNQQKKIDRMEQQIQRYRIWGEMRDSEKMFKKAKELEKRLEKMGTPEKPVLENQKIRLHQAEAERSGKIVLELENISKSFGNKPLLEDVNLTVFYGDSVCIMGRNGAGKTTLLKMILGESEPDGGTVKVGSRVKIGYLPQNTAFEEEESTVLEYFARLHDIPYGEARSQLAKALFRKEDVNKKISSLSGGEKGRLKLCSLAFAGVNLLILDEPTNHLDIDSREVLEETLAEFNGTLLFVSHDRYFIDRLADRIVVIEDRRTHVVNGGYTYYREELKKSLTTAPPPKNDGTDGGGTGYDPCKRADAVYPKNTGSDIGDNAKLIRNGVAGNAGNTATSDKDTKRTGRERASRKTDRHAGKDHRNPTEKNKGSKSLKKLQADLALAEQEIEEAEKRIASLEKLMDLNRTDGNRLAELFEEKTQAEEEWKKAYEKWEAATSELERDPKS